MQRVTLEITLAQLLSLEVEILGRADGKTKGLLRHNITIALKYELRKLINQLGPQREIYFEMYNEIIAKYASDGKSVSQFLEDNSPNPAFFECNKEIMALQEKTTDIDFPRINLDDIDDKTDEYFPVLFELIEKLEVAPAKENVPA